MGATVQMVTNTRVKSASLFEKRLTHFSECRNNERLCGLVVRLEVCFSSNYVEHIYYSLLPCFYTKIIKNSVMFLPK
jgi:hypothetical protein